MPNTQFEFQKKKTLSDRTNDANRLKQAYPKRIPVICAVLPNAKSIISLDKEKYLVPKEMTMGQFLMELRKRIRLQPHQALFVFMENGLLPLINKTLNELYQAHGNSDGFLYISISPENTFG